MGKSRKQNLGNRAFKAVFEKYIIIFHDDSAEEWTSEVKLWQRRISNKISTIRLKRSISAVKRC